MARIYCSVANCHYWKKGNICDASEILITSDSLGNTMPDSYDAPQASVAEETPVNTCMQTCCKTFVDRNSPQINADGVYKK
ncbi:MAG: DUF1540 domain-containing protein [Tepidanaerobacteraceae bacterium]|nr:DUF1540 domain-containing protein [Tepidanaerobacteraceae bacterium]